MNALLIRPKDPVTFWSFDEAMKMLGKKTAFPPLGLLTVAGMMPNDFNLRVADMNVRGLTDQDLLWADVVLTSSMIIHWNSLEEVISRCNAVGAPVMCGGPLATQYHEEIAGDAVFYLGEGENGFVDVVAAMASQSGFVGRQVIDRRGQFKSLDKTPLPRWDLINLRDYSNMVIQMTRGCPEKCTFCNIPALYGKFTRVKSRIIGELDALYEAGFSGPVMAVDDNFIGNAEAILRMLIDEIIPWQKERNYPFRFNTQASLRVADNPELLEAMRVAGFDKIFVGIESPVEESLKFMGAQKNRQGDMPLLDKVRILQEKKFEVQAGFIMGLDTDPKNIGDVMLEFIRRAGIPVAMVGPLGVLPDTPDYKRYERLGRLVKEVKYGGDSGVFSRELSFVPKRGAEWLLNTHRELVRVLNSPKIYFERCVTMFKLQQSPNLLAKMAIGWPEIRATLLSLWKQGVVGNYRTEYWKFLGHVARHHRQFLPNAVRLAVQGHHFIITTQQALQVDEVRTYMEVATKEFKRFAQGSRDAFRSAEGEACRLMDRLRSRLKEKRDGLPALRYNADVLKAAAREYYRSILPGFRRQLDGHLAEFRLELDRVIEGSKSRSDQVQSVTS